MPHFLHERRCLALQFGLLGTFFELRNSVVALPSGKLTDVRGPKLPPIASGLIGGKRLFGCCAALSFLI